MFWAQKQKNICLRDGNIFPLLYFLPNSSHAAFPLGVYHSDIPPFAAASHFRPLFKITSPINKVNFCEIRQNIVAGCRGITYKCGVEGGMFPETTCRSLIIPLWTQPYQEAWEQLRGLLITSCFPLSPTLSTLSLYLPSRPLHILYSQTISSPLTATERLS
jgi:hypothetical protein